MKDKFCINRKLQMFAHFTQCYYYHYNQVIIDTKERKGQKELIRQKINIKAYVAIG